VSGPDSTQVAQIYQLQAAFHLAKRTQSIDLMMSLWDVNGSLTIPGDPHSAAQLLLLNRAADYAGGEAKSRVGAMVVRDCRLTVSRGYDPS
jgi:hypothetical protein